MTLSTERLEEIEALARRHVPVTKGETFVGDEYLLCIAAVRELLAEVPVWRPIDEVPVKWVKRLAPPLPGHSIFQMVDDARAGILIIVQHEQGGGKPFRFTIVEMPPA